MQQLPGSNCQDRDSRDPLSPQSEVVRQPLFVLCNAFEYRIDSGLLVNLRQRWIDVNHASERAD